MQSFADPNKRAEFTRFVRFALTGILNTAVDFAVYLMVSFLGSGLLMAQTLGYAAGTCNSYVVNRRWTFQSRQRFFGPELLRFLIVNLVTLAVSLVAVSALERLLGDRLAAVTLLGQPRDLTRVVVKLPIVALTLVLNFVLSRLWVFRGQSSDE